MRQTVVPGVWSWSRWQADRNLDFNGFFVETPDGNMVVDPVEPDEETLRALRERGVATVVITNRDHERETAAIVAATGARTLASALDAPLLAHPVDLTVEPGEKVHGWTVIGLDGCKTAGEIALYDRARRAAIVGDVVWGTPAGALTFMPDAKLADPPRAVLSMRQLRALAVDHLLVGDGACLFGNAHDVLQAMLEARADAFTTRINLLDEVVYTGGQDDPAPFTADWADVGRLIGAQKLGYGVARLKRGDAFCPLHWHTREEELFVVLAGAPTLRTPRGTFALRAGDVVAFRTDSSGAHRISNDA
ncbi:MAG: cupin domain-containing protein, partial [Candidatus Elarobacter sp.]